MCVCFVNKSCRQTKEAKANESNRWLSAVGWDDPSQQKPRGAPVKTWDLHWGVGNGYISSSARRDFSVRKQSSACRSGTQNTGVRTRHFSRRFRNWGRQVTAVVGIRMVQLPQNQMPLHRTYRQETFSSWYNIIAKLNATLRAARPEAEHLPATGLPDSPPLVAGAQSHPPPNGPPTAGL